MSQRHAVTKKMAAAYKRATKSDKAAILDSLVELTGWRRGHACHVLKEAGTIKLVVPRRPRPAKYPVHLSTALVLVWTLRQPIPSPNLACRNYGRTLSAGSSIPTKESAEVARIIIDLDRWFRSRAAS